MRLSGLVLLLVTALLVGQVAAGSQRAVLLKAHPYQLVRNGYPLPKRLLAIGTVVKVLTTHGKQADVATSSGDTLSVRLVDLRLLQDPPVLTVAPFPPPKPPAAPAAPAVAPPPVAPAPSPVQPGGTQVHAADAGSKSAGDSGRRAAPVRCSHLLKNGEQCSRMTSSPNGLCWQHGGD